MRVEVLPYPHAAKSYHSQALEAIETWELVHMCVCVCVCVQATQTRDALQARLNALQMGFTEVEHQARLALDDVRPSDQTADTNASGGSDGGSAAAGVRAMLERIRRVAGDALSASVAEKRGAAGVASVTVLARGE